MILRFILAAALSAGAGVSAKTVLPPTADAQVMNNTASTNYGSAGTMAANSNNGVRVIYLRFDLSGITGPITRITLDLTSAGAGYDSYHIYGITNGENWQESTITWNNAPGIINSYTTISGTQSQILNPGALFRAGTPLASFSAPGAPECHNRAADVTYGPLLDFIREDADKIVSFLIVEQDPLDGPGVVWYTREATTESYRPKLMVYGENETWPTTRVVLLGGQSNMDGRAAGSTLPADLQPPQANIPFYYQTYTGPVPGTMTTLRSGATQTPNGGFGPEISLGKNLAPWIEQTAGNQLALVKYARGGTNLHVQWKAGGDSSALGDGEVYVAWQQAMRIGISKVGALNPDARIDLAAMVWVQGESDVTHSDAAAAAYEQNLRAFIDDVRKTIRPNLPFFFSRLSDNQTELFNTATELARYPQVKSAQDAVAASVPGAYLLACDGPDYPVSNDNLHYTAGGLVKIGTEFAKMIVPRVILRQSLTKAPDSGAQLQWNAVPGRSYYLDRSEDLRIWQRTAIGAVTGWTDAETPATRFYRVAEAD